MSAGLRGKVPGALCLPKQLCAEACDLEAGCKGINVTESVKALAVTTVEYPSSQAL